MWIIFIYASAIDEVRREQWEILKVKRNSWGNKWIMGGDFNEIVSHEDKNGGNRRGDGSFRPFKTFICEMGMGEIVHRGRRWTWANNRKGEGFIEERLDMFFGSADWLVDFARAEVQHLLNQASDHSMLLLDLLPHQQRIKSRFVFDSRWSRTKGCDETV